MIALLGLLLAQDAPAPPRDVYDCYFSRPFGGGHLFVMQTSEGDGTQGRTMVSWSQDGIVYRARDLSVGTDPAFTSVSWEAERPPATPAALARSLAGATVSIRVVTPRRLGRRPIFRFVRDEPGVVGLTLGGYADVAGRFPWASVEMKWRDLLAYAGPGDVHLRYELARYAPSPNRYEGPIREGRINLSLVINALNTVPALLDEIGARRAERERVCQRRTISDERNPAENL
jgi:hypothetical protein